MPKIYTRGLFIMNLDNLYMFLHRHGKKLDHDVFEYGLAVLIRYGIYFFVILIVSIFFHKVFDVLCFMIPYFSFRSQLGGIHVQNSILCIALTVLTTFVIPCGVSFLPEAKFFFLFLFYLAGMLATWLLKTADHPNKPLSPKEIQYHTHRALNRELFYLFFLVLFYCLDMPLYAYEILISLWICLFEIVFVHLKRRFLC